jgi:acyl carrier protein
MEREQILNQIYRVIKETVNRDINDDLLREDVDIIQTIGMNSIDAIGVLVKIEEIFGIEIEDEDLSVELIRSSGSLAKYVAEKLESKG